MKGKKKHGLKGVPDNWDEVKQRYNLALTPTAVNSLDAIASRLEISRSELIERVARAIASDGMDVEKLLSKADVRNVYSSSTER